MKNKVQIIYIKDTFFSCKLSSFSVRQQYWRSVSLKSCDCLWLSCLTNNIDCLQWNGTNGCQIKSCQVSMYVNRTKRPTNGYCVFSTDFTSAKLVYKHKSVHPPLSLRKQPTFRDASTDFPQKWCLGKKQQFGNESKWGICINQSWNGMVQPA